MRRTIEWGWPLRVGAAALMALLGAGSVFAAEFGGGDVYRLPADQVIDDDLTVAARMIYIDGQVKGDLVAVGAYVEINGVVTGDVLAAAAEVRINGEVEDDVRAGGIGVTLTGLVGDHFFAVASGSQGAPAMPSVSGRASIAPGVRIESRATVEGSAYIAAGEAIIDGVIDNDLSVNAGVAILNGEVGGDASLGADTVTIGSIARVAGELYYSAPAEVDVPPGVAGEVRFERREQPEPTARPAFDAGRIWRVLLALAGFALLGWLLLRFAPGTLLRPAQTLAARPGRVALYGIAALAVLFAIPLLSGLIFLVILLFWGWLPAIMFALLLTAALVLAWTLSPLITGLWAGRALLAATGRKAGDFAALCLGVAVIALASLLPWIGWLVGLISLVFALGAVIAARRRPLAEDAATFT